MAKNKFDVETIRRIYFEHERYWEQMQTELERLKAVYEIKFWDKDKHGMDGESMVLVEVSTGYEFVEQYQASLFAKNPAVVIEHGLRKKGDPNKSQGISNNFLLTIRSILENTSRIGLIYPNAFIKLIPIDSPDVYEKISTVALPPWEVIVDRDAPRWDRQHYTGHVYWLTELEAQAKFGNKQYDLQCKEEFFRKGEKGRNQETEEIFQYIKVVELYDFVNNKLYWWSPNYSNGDKLLDKADFIPFTDYASKPLAPFAPLYYNRIPDMPMVGYSALSRVYDQILEQNVIRTFQANAVRKASRQWLVQKGKLDEEDMAKLTSGTDGAFVEVELDHKETLGGIITPVPHVNTPTEVQTYYNEVTKDKDKGSILAPFTRGEATKASATEASALIFYNSSEIGRLARERDAAIEYLVYLYLNMLAMYVEDAREEGESTRVLLDGEHVSVLPEDLRGDFNIFTADTSSTPMSDLVKKQEFLANIPIMTQLGIQPEKIRREFIRLMGLPEDFDEVVEAGKVTAEGQSLEEAPPEELLQQAVVDPSAANVAPLLQAGGLGAPAVM